MSRDDVGDDALQRLIDLNTPESGLRPKLSRLVSVFGLSERLIQKVNDPKSPSPWCIDQVSRHSNVVPDVYNSTAQRRVLQCNIS